MSKNIYRFRVGVRKLNSSSSGSASTSLGSSGLLHAALLINTDLFEYSSAGYVRRKNVGRDSQFNWDEIGSALNGTTYVSPDDLEIKNMIFIKYQKYEKLIIIADIFI
ncbi:hypothetical protein M9Y10_029644 [Tritrichomonas musculus]|uniref:Uncharacterized protein n=1 Tax=Tritrichomonas musculus TaxID=1915356 RepID=A0ABR2KMP7_9EUKA